MRNFDKLEKILEKVLLAVISLFMFVVLYSKKFVKICFVLLLISCIILAILKYKKTFYKHLAPKNKLYVCLGLFFISAILSAVFSINPYISQEILFQRYLIYILFFIIGCFITKEYPKYISIIAVSFFISGIFFCLGALHDYLLAPNARLFTVFGKTGMLISAFLLFFMPLTYTFLIFSKKRIYRLLSFFAFILAFLIFLWHGSRGTWVAIGTTLFAISFLKSKKLPFLLLLLYFSAFFIVPNNLQYRVLTLLVPFDKEIMKDRVNMMSTTIDIYKKHPVFGAGEGMFEHLYIPPNKHPDYIHLHAHNTYLEIASEMGTVGLLAFLLIFFKFFCVALKKIKNNLISLNERIALVGISGVVLASLFASFFGTLIIVGVQDASLFWFMLGIGSYLASRDTSLAESKI